MFLLGIRFGGGMAVKAEERGTILRSSAAFEIYSFI